MVKVVNRLYASHLLIDFSFSMSLVSYLSIFRIVTIDSYINNLHPEWHKDLYTTIGGVFEKFVPLFNKVIVTPLPSEPNIITVIHLL